METLSARTEEGRGNKQNTRVSQTTCHKAFSRTGLTGTASSQPAPGVRPGSTLRHCARNQTRRDGREKERENRQTERERDICFLSWLHGTFIPQTKVEGYYPGSVLSKMSDKVMVRARV